MYVPQKFVTRLDQCIDAADSSMMYSYLVDVTNLVEKFSSYKGTIDAVGNTSPNDESYRDVMIEIIKEVHEWATEAFSDGGKDYYPNNEWSFIKFMEKQ